MGTGLRYGLLIAIAIGPAADAVRGQQPDSLPEGVRPAAVAQGKKLFAGAGLCAACHGADAKGTIGPDLTDTTWLHGKGSFAEILATIRNGVLPDQSKTGQIMPPGGGSGLSDAQLSALAAYVWTLSRPPARK